MTYQEQEIKLLSSLKSAFFRGNIIKKVVESLPPSLVSLEMDYLSEDWWGYFKRIEVLEIHNQQVPLLIEGFTNHKELRFPKLVAHLAVELRELPSLAFWDFKLSGCFPQGLIDSTLKYKPPALYWEE